MYINDILGTNGLLYTLYDNPSIKTTAVHGTSTEDITSIVPVPYSLSFNTLTSSYSSNEMWRSEIELVDYIYPSKMHNFKGK